MPLTTHLAPELVIQVFNYVDPATLVSLACSCQFLEKVSRDILKKHRDAHTRYRVVTDVEPRSLIETLRKTTADPSLAWHVREIEFTSGRTKWLDWQACETPEYAFKQNEQVALLDRLREAFHFDEQAIDQARDDLQHGNDGPAKLLLLGACPGLRSVKFTRHFHRIGKGVLERDSSSDDDDRPRTSLQYLHHAILIHLQNKPLVWPVGLSSLKELSIGVGVGDSITTREFAPSPYLIANMMQLPHLVSLYSFGLDLNFDYEAYDDQYMTNKSAKLAKGSSSVQHLLIDGALGNDRTSLEAIFSGCKQLKTLTITDGDLSNVDALVEFVGECHEGSLETLMFYETTQLRGYRCNLFRPEAISKYYFRNVRMIYIDASDVMLDAFYNHKGRASDKPGHEWIDDFDFFMDFFMDIRLPENMEVLVLGRCQRSQMYEGDAEFWDQAITQMIESGRGEGCCGKRGKHAPFYPNLKAIYIGSVDELPHPERRKRPRKRWFSRAIAAGRKYGVDVHTRTTRGPIFHEINFPKPPLISSQPSTLVFDEYTGTWEEPGYRCSNCGACEQCLVQYDVSVWREIQDDESHQ